MIAGTGKSMRVKDWFANKIANEVKRNINRCDVFCVLKETDKAVYAMLNLGCDFRKTMWIPKSVIETYEVGEDENTLLWHHETKRTDSYDEAVLAFKAHWAMYK